MPRGANSPDQRGQFIADVERGLALIKGHFDSAWMIDHLEFKDADLLEGWTAIDAQNKKTTVKLNHQRYNGAVPDTAFQFAEPKKRGRA